MREKIIEILKKTAPETGDIEVSVPENDTLGHYSTNVAFRLAKSQKISPVEAGQKLKEKIMALPDADIFKKIDVVNPGFINFWLKDEVWYGELKEVLKKKSSYGRRSIVKGQLSKVQLEYVSANPTGYLTMANGRGGFLGDVLANALEFTGAKVEREYYVNDTGNQILTLGKSLIVALGLNLGQPADEEKFYKGDYIKKWARKNKAVIQKNKDNPLKLGQIAAADFLKSIQKVLKDAGIHFDRFTSEEENIHKKGYIDKALAIFGQKALTYEKEGAAWLKTTEFHDDKDRVLITSDKFPTYFLADSGHYLETKERGFEHKIIILGPDHYGYVARIQAAAKILGIKKSETIVTQAVRVVKDGKEIKMSKRKGEFITFEEVAEEVGKDAARFFFLMYSWNTHMDFDLALAKERSVKNPVYYVQYAFVRCEAILQKIKNQKSKIKITNQNLKLLNTEAITKLIRELLKFPEVVEDIASDYQVHRLTRYATDVAKLFHNFYEKERIMPALRSFKSEGGGEKDKNLAAARLELVKATQIVLGNTLDLLGISKPKRM